jgi:hypothetical protein
MVEMQGYGLAFKSARTLTDAFKRPRTIVQIPLAFVTQKPSHQPWQCHKIKQVQIFELQFTEKAEK